MYYKHIFSLLFLASCFYSTGQVQCTVDITIDEGASVDMCSNALTSISGANGFVSYSWTGPEALSGQTITPQFSGVYTLSATDAVSCISTITIQVNINTPPVPVIVSSEGSVICPSVGTTLSTTTPFVTYDWGGGVATSTFFVDSPASYTVTVTDANNCSGQESILISSFDFGLVSSAVSGCTSTGVALTASGGTGYAWSTGEFGNTIIVDPTAPTNYSVVITAGSCTETLSITVQPIELLEYELEDTIYVGVNENIFISGPEGFSAYEWTPDDQIDSPFSQGVNFSGTESQLLTVTATHPSGCTISDNVNVIVVDLSIPNGFSPNGDLKNEFFVIPELETENYDAEITIWNRWGELVVEQSDYKNDWNGTCKTDLCLGSKKLPEGTYFYHINVHEVTFKGYITLKR